MPTRVTIEALAGWLLEQDDIALLGHVSPDGDAMGCCLALKLALQALGKRAEVCLPGGMVKMYRWLPGAGEILDPADPLPFAPKAALAVDVSDPERLGAAGRRLFEAAAHRAVLDHHSTNSGFGELFALDGAAAATGELAVRLIDALGATLTPAMAECLFVAVSTDCGQFSFSNTRAQTLCAAARCVEAGIDVASLTGRLYRTRTRGRTKLTGLVLSGLETSPDGRIAWARLTEDMLDAAGAIREDNEGIVNYLLEIEGVECAVLAEQRGSATKFSLRSKETLDVARDVAAPLGGGGHARAAGVTLESDMEAALARVLGVAEAALRDQNAQAGSK